MPHAKSPEHLALGDVLRATRQEAGLSQEAAADRASLHRVYFGRVERGEVNVAWTNLLAVLGALGLSVGEFGRRYDAAHAVRTSTSAAAADASAAAPAADGRT